MLTVIVWGYTDLCRRNNVFSCKYMLIVDHAGICLLISSVWVDDVSLLWTALRLGTLKQFNAITNLFDRGVNLFYGHFGRGQTSLGYRCFQSWLKMILHFDGLCVLSRFTSNTTRVSQVWDLFSFWILLYSKLNYSKFIIFGSGTVNHTKRCFWCYMLHWDINQ